MTAQQPDHHRPPSRQERKTRDLSQLGAYVLVVLLAGVGLQQLHASDQRIGAFVEQQCYASQDNRLALRAQASATAAIARDLVRAGDNTTRQQRALAQLDQFERDQLAKLPPITCPPPDELP